MTHAEITAALGMPNAELHKAAHGDFYWLNVMHNHNGQRLVFSETLPGSPDETDIAIAKLRYAQWLSKSGIPEQQ